MSIKQTPAIRWDERLITEWYRLGSMMPFFRAHAGFTTHRREPWLFSPWALETIRKQIMLRYRLLFYIYTQFYLASREEFDFVPVMRPLWLDYP